MGHLGQVDCIVVGAGVIGLACARAIAASGREVLVLEAEGRLGEHGSGRNSEVIHAGIYYPENSLKARLCVAGKNQLYSYLEQRGIGHRRLGKLIVAVSEEELAALEGYRRQGAVNGVNDLQLLDSQQLSRLEPDLRAQGGLFSPSTGIFDSHAYMLCLQADLAAAGGELVFRSAVTKIGPNEHGFRLQVGPRGDTISCRCLVNAAGLGAWDLALGIQGFPREKVPPCYYAKGHYMTYSGRIPFKRLVYPLAQSAGLGTHLTIDMAGQGRFGPDVAWVKRPDYGFDAGLVPRFAESIRRYWPGLDETRLGPGYVGVRPKLLGPGEPAADFLVQDETQHGFAGLIHLFGIESPGLTASLAIGDYVLTLLEH